MRRSALALVCSMLLVACGDAADDPGTSSAPSPAPSEPVELVEAEIAVGEDPIGIASGEGSLWVVNARDGTVSRIDPAANEVTATIEVGDVPLEVVAGEGSVWVSNSGEDTLSRIDP